MVGGRLLNCLLQLLRQGGHTLPLALLLCCMLLAAVCKYPVNKSLAAAGYVQVRGSNQVGPMWSTEIILASPVAIWDGGELVGLSTDSSFVSQSDYELSFSRYNPTPGTGATGFLRVPPNNYPFYNEDEKYVPVMQPDGGQLSEWKPMYNPSKEQAEADRRAAYEAGVPHGYMPAGDKYRDLETIQLWVVSELHDDSEYGASVGEGGRHSGGPFTVEVSPKMRVEDLRLVIRDQGGILPALQKLSYAGKRLEDAQRTLEHYGVAYWHQRFPHWPLKIRKY